MQSAAFWETIVALVMVTGIGLGLVWIGIGYCRNVRAIHGGIAAAATIDKLDYTGRYLTGRFFALISFRDATGLRHAARLPLMPYIWNRLREGGTLHIVYAPADPRIVSRVGPGLQRFAGVVFVGIGSFLTLLGLWLLIGGLLGWTENRAFRPHQGWLTPLPAPRGGEMPTLK